MALRIRIVYIDVVDILKTGRAGDCIQCRVLRTVGRCVYGSLVPDLHMEAKPPIQLRAARRYSNVSPSLCLHLSAPHSYLSMATERVCQ